MKALRQLINEGAKTYALHNTPNFDSPSLTNRQNLPVAIRSNPDLAHR
jgi:hypothetical protein